MTVKKLLMGGLFMGAGLLTMLAFPRASDADMFCITCGSTTPNVQVKFEGVATENTGTIGSGANGGSCLAGNCAETTWGIGNLTSVEDNNNNTLWQSSQNFGPQAHQQIAFMLSGIADQAINPLGSPPGSAGFDIYNTGSHGAQTASYQGGPTVTITGDGNIHLQLFSYTGNAPNFNALNISNRTGAQTFSGITDISGATLMADFVLIPGIVAPGTTVNGQDVSNATMFQHANFTTDPSTTTGDFYAICDAGYACGTQWTNFGNPNDASAIVAALFGAFTGESASLRQNDRGWLEALNDPAFLAVPEPTSLLLLGSMLTVFGAALRRRRRDGMSA